MDGGQNKGDERQEPRTGSGLALLQGDKGLPQLNWRLKLSNQPTDTATIAAWDETPLIQYLPSLPYEIYPCSPWHNRASEIEIL